MTPFDCTNKLKQSSSAVKVILMCATMLAIFKFSAVTVTENFVVNITSKDHIITIGQVVYNY